MKKYKVYFSIFNLFNDSQKEVVKIQTYIKAGTATVATSTFMATNAEMAMIVGAVGFLLDAITACFYFEEIK